MKYSKCLNVYTFEPGFGVLMRGHDELVDQVVCHEVFMRVCNLTKNY